MCIRDRGEPADPVDYDSLANMISVDSTFIASVSENILYDASAVSQFGDTLYLSSGKFLIIPGLSQSNLHWQFTEYGTVTDIDGNEYQTLMYGDKEWMVENLRSTSFSNGDPITYGSEYYNEGPNYENVFGNLYHYNVLTDSRNVCPSGWHISTKFDWESFVNYFIPEIDLDSYTCLLYTSPSPRDATLSRMPSSA